MKTETVEDIVKRVRRECNSYPLPNAAADMLKLVREIEPAHKREVDAILKDRDAMYKSEQETIAKTNAWFEEYQTLKREVAELRECLEEACRYHCGKCNVGNLETESHFCGNYCDTIKRWRKALGEGN